MTIIRHRNGGVTLKGESARAFLRQLKEPPPPEAIESARRGIEMVRLGYVPTWPGPEDWGPKK